MNRNKSNRNIRQWLAMFILLVATSLAACTNDTRQNGADDADDGITYPAEQADMEIDSSGNASFGTEGEVPTQGKDDDVHAPGGTGIDTLPTMDRGVQPDDIYEEADTARSRNNQ